jgi:cytochrome c-type biogenesis protein CcmH/NrfG
MHKVNPAQPAAHPERKGADLRSYIAALERACGAEPESADLHTCLGVAYAADKHYGRAKEAFDRAVELNPAHFFAHLRYAELLIARGHLRAAEQRAKMAEAAARTRSQRSMSRRLLAAVRNARTAAPEPARNLPVPA